MLIDYHTHPQAHGEYQFNPERLQAFLDAAAAQGLAELGFTDHDNLAAEVGWDLIAHLRTAYPSLSIKLGLEVDYLPERQMEIGALLGTMPLDYVLGSVHTVDGFQFDVWEERSGYDAWEPDALYRRYYQLLVQAIQLGCFDILAHLDVIKVFGFRPLSDATRLALPVIKAAKRAGLAVEINSNGWHKPVAEVYPARPILEACFDLGIPITLGSDAHQPEQVGRDLETARELAWQVGYRQVAAFQQRRRYMLPL
jgi:histidinol-phosphatase (PHP family)